jgi:DNA-binding CsgD family transcriptional regulator/GAF domain-containing protein
MAVSPGGVLRPGARERTKEQMMTVAASTSTGAGSADELALADCEQAWELAGCPAAVDQGCSLDDQLAAARRLLHECVIDTSLPDDVRAQAWRQLYQVHSHQSRRLDELVSRSIRTVSEICRGVESLVGKSTEALIEAVPRAICQELPFERAMVSSVHRSMWMPRQTFFVHGDDPKDAEFARYASRAQILMADAPFETEILRNRTATMINSPESDDRTCRELIEASGSSGYVAAPIIARGHAIGILHADRPAGRGTVSQSDLDTLGSFADCLSLRFENAILAERLHRSTSSLEDEFVEMVEELSEVAHSSYRPDRLSGAGMAAATATDQAGSIASVLTAREREVLSHLATGATNAQIARALVIADDTVKSHLKQISKKLGTSTRSAAVAKFAALTAKAAVSR